MKFFGFLNRGPPVNWFGLIAGVLMLALPFLGPWWRFTAGTGAADVALSPFDMSFSILGQTVHSSFIEIFLLAAKIGMVIAGAFMVAGSVFPKSWWGRQLVRYGMMKPLWTLVFLIVMLVIGAVLMNSILPGMMSGMMGQTGGDVTMDISMPYISGSSVSTIEVQGMAIIKAPINAWLTWKFWIAICAAVMGVMARIYQRNFAPGKAAPEVAAAKEWFCTQCGIKNREEVKFCEKCGAKMGAPEKTKSAEAKRSKKKVSKPEAEVKVELESGKLEEKATKSKK